MTIKYQTWLSPQMSLEDLSGAADGRRQRRRLRRCRGNARSTHDEERRVIVRPIASSRRRLPSGETPSSTRSTAPKARITLSLFRCTDKAIFAELAAAVDRGVDVQVLVTSRAKGGKQKLKKLWERLEETRRVDRTPTPIRSSSTTRNTWWSTMGRRWSRR